jgi:hypothetical protein
MISRTLRRAASTSQLLPPVSYRRHSKMPLHHLMIGTWTPPGAIFTVAFDDEKLTLELVNRTPIPEAEPISWMTFDHGKKNIYGAAMKKWSSFAVKGPTNIVHEVSHPIGGDRMFRPIRSVPDAGHVADLLLNQPKQHPPTQTPAPSSSSPPASPPTTSTPTPSTTTPATATSSPCPRRGC